MIAEIILTVLISLAVGAGIMKLALKNKKVEMLVDRSEKKKYDIMNDPDLLLEKLNKNGVMVDDGDEISFVVEEKDGKKQLVQKIKKNVAAKGVPKLGKRVVKKGIERKNPKGGGSTSNKKGPKK